MSYITDTSTPASKVIHLDSKHAHTYHNKDEDGNVITTSFVYHMNEAIVCPEHLSMICSLHTCTIPYSFYNVRHKVNNALVVTYVDGGGVWSNDYKIVFPSGNYTALSLARELVSTMNGSTNFLLNPWAGEAGPPDTRVYRLYKKLNGAWEPQLSNPFLQSATPLTIKASLDRTRIRYHIWQNSDASEANTISFGWGDATDTTAQDLFGFRVDFPITNIPYSADGTKFVSSDKVIDMNDEIHGLYLRTSLTTDGTLNSETGTFSNILSRISVNTNPGGVIFHTPNNSSHKLQISLPVIKFIGVKLTDDKNRLLDLNGLNFQISFQIDFVPRLESLTGMSKAERRAGHDLLRESTKAESRSKINKIPNKKNKSK